jgi:hypothetical protein
VSHTICYQYNPIEPTSNNPSPVIIEITSGPVLLPNVDDHVYLNHGDPSCFGGKVISRLFLYRPLSDDRGSWFSNNEFLTPRCLYGRKRRWEAANLSQFGGVAGCSAVATVTPYPRPCRTLT